MVLRPRSLDSSSGGATLEQLFAELGVVFLLGPMDATAPEFLAHRLWTVGSRGERRVALHLMAMFPPPADGQVMRELLGLAAGSECFDDVVAVLAGLPWRALREVLPGVIASRLGASASVAERVAGDRLWDHLRLPGYDSRRPFVEAGIEGE